MKKGIVLTSASLLFILLLAPFLCSGQPNLPAPKLDIYVEFTGDSVSFDISDSLSTYAGDSIELFLLVDIPSGAVPSKVHVKAGTSQGGAQLLEKAFVYDGPADQGGGTSYGRDGRNVRLGLGGYSGVAKIYVQAWLEDASGNLSAVREVRLGH